jgi:hypothetical protein
MKAIEIWFLSQLPTEGTKIGYDFEAIVQKYCPAESTARSRRSVLRKVMQTLEELRLIEVAEAEKQPFIWLTVKGESALFKALAP